MELKQFIKEALLNIVNGIEEANKENDRFKILGVKHESGIDGNFVDFDVSVVVNESSGSEVGGKVGASFLKVVSASVDSKIDQTSSHQNIHRLTFKVYISEKKI
ncbi:MAG: hypothetical protein WC998_00100 [Candidatus Paceibacterota bacterium]|jgi:hypothetical protein